MIQHSELADKDLRNLIKSHKIELGGNRNLKIFGTLNCTSGKRMKRENRVFFTSKTEAIENGFRPCGRCLIEAYKKWKNNGLV